MQVIAIVSAKGGTGKSTLAHALAWRATLRQAIGIMVHTDQRPPLNSSGRPYGYIDGRTPERLVQVLEDAACHEGLLIIDGGGNRPTFDHVIAQTADLVLVPATLNAEDVRLTLQDLERLPNAKAIFNRWPVNPFTRAVARRYEARLPPERYLGRLLEVGSVRTLLEDAEPWQTPPTKVNNFARVLYGLVRSALR